MSYYRLVPRADGLFDVQQRAGLFRWKLLREGVSDAEGRIIIKDAARRRSGPVYFDCNGNLECGV